MDRPADVNETHGLDRLLQQWSEGDLDAVNQVVAHAYEELHALAGSYMRREREGHTLGPTMLVHEVYFRLVGEEMPEVTSRSQFLGISARLMKQILINHARARASLKRGGEYTRIPMDQAIDELADGGIDVLVLDDLLERLAKHDPLLVRVVELRFFGGLTIEETAEVLGISKRKVVSSWTFARAWLRKESLDD